MISLSLFGRDIPLAAVSEQTLMGFKAILSGFKKGSPIRIKLSDGRTATGFVQRKLGNALVAEVNGKPMIVKKLGPKPASRATVTVEPTEVK